MAENNDGMEKSEQASAKKLDDARGKGQVPSTKELSPVLMIFGAMGIIALWAPTAWQHIQAQSRYWFESVGVRMITQETLYQMIVDVVHHTLLPFLAFPVMMMGLGVLAMLIQTGPMWVKDGIQPKISKLNPISGFKRIISLRGWVELLKSFLKIGLLTIVAYVAVADRVLELIEFPSFGIEAALMVMGGIVFQMMLWVGLTMLVLAVADFAYQKWQFTKDQRMTKQEVKDETKDIEGNPLVRSRRQSLQRDRARQRMMQAVPTADVVITNPTHLAVALKYAPGQENAPTVVAKGAGILAERIREIARHASVPIVENKSLAQSIYKVVAVGKSIPVDLYKAVAEILAYVYRLKQEHDAMQG